MALTAWTFMPGYIHHQSGAAALYRALTFDELIFGLLNQLQRLNFDYLYRTTYMGGESHINVTGSTAEIWGREKWICKIYAPETTTLNNVENVGQYTDVYYTKDLTGTPRYEETIN